MSDPINPYSRNSAAPLSYAAPTEAAPAPTGQPASLPISSAPRSVNPDSFAAKSPAPVDLQGGVKEKKGEGEYLKELHQTFEKSIDEAGDPSFEKFSDVLNQFAAELDVRIAEKGGGTGVTKVFLEKANTKLEEFMKGNPSDEELKKFTSELSTEFANDCQIYAAVVQNGMALAKQMAAEASKSIKG